METINIRGLDISRFSLGTVQLGVNYGLANTIGVPSQEKAFELLNTARQVGVNCLDTANATAPARRSWATGIRIPAA